MFKDREKLYQVYHTVLSLALTLALTLTINQYFNLKVNIIVCAVFSLIPASLIYLFDMNKRNTISYILLLSIIPILGLLFWIRRINPIIWVQDLFNWCYYYDGSKELYSTAHAYVVVLLVAIIGTILFYLLVKKQMAKIAMAALLFVAMLVLSIRKIDINKAVVGISIFYFLSILVELHGYIYNRKGGKQEKKAGILYLAPICLLLAVLSISLPSKPEPIQWNGVKNIYHNIKNQFDIWMTEMNYYFKKTNGEFTVTFSGYNENGSALGNGELTKNEKVALEVSGTVGNEPIYLIGSISDVYTGSSWKKSHTDFKSEINDYLLDYTELEAALSRQNQEELKNERFVERRLFSIEYNNIKTKTFFYPIKSSWFNILTGRMVPIADSADILFPHAVGNGMKVEYVFYQMNLQGEAFQNMLRNAKSFSNQDNSNDPEMVNFVDSTIFENDKIPTILGNPNFNVLMQERADTIKNQYTQLPEGLPGRDRELAKRLTENYTNDYDKLKAIEMFLKDYTYNTNPGISPKGEDFVDYFLFDNKKGYCTSFASAMAVLARCAGIPTRYVEGFVVSFDQKDKSGMFPVKNSQAHAWAEAYIEGVGWIPFEATPPFYDKRYVKWKEIAKTQTDSFPDYRSGYDPHIQDFMNANKGKDITEGKKKDNFKNAAAGAAIFISTVLTLFIAFVIYDFALNYRYRKSFQRADYSRRMYLLFLRILYLLKREGFILEEQETILMLANRVKDRFHYDRVTFPEVADIFMRNRYGEEAVTKEELARVEVYYQGLSNKRREEMSRLRILLEDFIFLARKSNR